MAAAGPCDEATDAEIEQDGLAVERRRRSRAEDAPEQEGGDKGADRAARAVAGRQEQGQREERAGGPVERHDPGRGFIGGGCVDHDEAGEHEEEVDAGLADLEPTDAEAGMGMQELENMEGNDALGGKGPQNL